MENGKLLAPEDLGPMFLDWQPELLGQFVHYFNLTSEDAEDMLQEAFLRAYKALQKGSPVPAIKARGWLWRIACNIAIDAYRRQHRIVILPLSADFPATDPIAPLLERLAMEQRLTAVEQSRAEALLLSSAGYSQQEIARQQGLSTSTVKMRLWRTRTQLRTQAARSRASA